MSSGSQLVLDIGFDEYKPYLSKADKKNSGFLAILGGSVLRASLVSIIVFDCILVGWYLLVTALLPAVKPQWASYPFTGTFWTGQIIFVLGALVAAYYSTCQKKYTDGWSNYCGIGGSLINFSLLITSSVSAVINSDTRADNEILLENNVLSKAFDYAVKHYFRDGGVGIELERLPLTKELIADGKAFSKHSARTNNGNPMPSKGDIIINFISLRIRKCVSSLRRNDKLTPEIERSAFSMIDGWHASIGAISLGTVIPDPKPFREVMKVLLFAYLAMLPCVFLNDYSLVESLILNTLFVYGLMGIIIIGPYVSRVFDNPDTNPVVRNQRIGSQSHAVAANIDNIYESMFHEKKITIKNAQGRDLSFMDNDPTCYIDMDDSHSCSSISESEGTSSDESDDDKVYNKRTVVQPIGKTTDSINSTTSVKRTRTKKNNKKK